MGLIKKLFPVITAISIPTIGFSLGGVFGGLGGITVDIVLISITINNYR